jgi:sigma54-dependent transcription regulator
VGETRTRTANVRLVAATNRDLESALTSGSFREDLMYRLKVVELMLPPLREWSDIQKLAVRLLAFFTQQTGRPLTGFTPEARQALARHSWPGNLRFVGHRTRLDGPGRLSFGEAIGGGAVEGAAKTLGLRLKARGARWRHKNARAMAALIGCRQTEPWDLFWARAA